jgi:hypothetical protein
MKVDKTVGCTAPSSANLPVCSHTLFVTPTMRQTVFADNPSSGRLNSYLLMLSQWRISATNRGKDAWSRAFIGGAQIKWYKRMRFFRAFSSVVRQMPGWCPQRRGTARTLRNFFVALCIFCVLLYAIFVLFYVFYLCCSMWCLFCDVPCIVCVYICVLNNCHRVATQLQLNISYINCLRLAVCPDNRATFIRIKSLSVWLYACISLT